MSNYIELSNDGEVMTCLMPADETIVEVRLIDGTVRLAYFSKNILEAGDWDFMPLDAEFNPDIGGDSLADRVGAWREQTLQ